MANGEWRCSHIVAPAKAVLRRAGWRRSRNPPSCRTMRRITLRSNPAYKSASFSTSPRSAPEGMQDLPPGGRGECRVPSAPAASCAKWVVQNAHEYSQRSHRKSPGIPARNGLRLTSCSPRRSGFLVTVAGGVLTADLTPASRRQDHTIFPYASAPIVHRRIRVHRIPLRVRDVAQRPSVWSGMANHIA